jgi:hypothetical protein
MRETRSSGSVEGVMSNHDHYSDRERSSEPLGPEFCAVHREVHGEA